jgi:hypothetical protein
MNDSHANGRKYDMTAQVALGFRRAKAHIKGAC